MSHAASHPMAELLPSLDQGSDAILTKDPPTCPGNDQGAVRRSVSLSPYGVEEMTEEDRERYNRSASLSPSELKKSQSHQPSPKEPSTHPEVPPFRLTSERLMDQKDQIEETSRVSRKRKRPSTPAPNVLASSKPKSPEPEGPCKFQGAIEYKRFEEAMEFAWKMEKCEMKTDTIHRHIFWTDASIVFRACAAGAVAWKQPPSWEWTSESFPYPYCIQSTEVVEMFAIAHALKRAVNEVKQSQRNASKDFPLQITHEVFVFTDSIGALTMVENDASRYHVQKTCEQAHTIIGYSIELHNLGVKVELHLVPGHNGVPGNVKAHGAAYAAARRAAAVAGITSQQQAVALHKSQGSVAIFTSTQLSLVPASPVQARPSKRAQKRPSLLSRPLLWRNLRAETPPMLVPPLDSTDDDSGELVKTTDKIAMSLPGPHFVRPDRTPERDPNPDPYFTPINAGPALSTGFTPANASSAMLTGGPAKVSPARTPAPALDSRHWFTPVNARPTLLVGSSSPSPSVGTQKHALVKNQKTGTAAVESLKSAQAEPLSAGPWVSSTEHEPTSIDNATSSFEAGRLPFPPVNNAPAAVLDSSAVSVPCLEASNPARTPGSMLLSPCPVYQFTTKDSEKGVFGEPALSFSIPQAEPDAMTSALAAASHFHHSQTLTTHAVPVPAPTQAFSTVPHPMKASHGLPPCPPTKHSLTHRGDATLPSRPSILGTLKTSPSFVTTSKMKSFASPREPRDGLTLAPISLFYDVKPKQCEDTALLPLPPSMRDVPKPSSFIVTTSKMRSFASPGEPRDGLTLGPIPIFNGGDSRPVDSSVPRWPPLFTQFQTIPPDVAKFRLAESSSDNGSSASTPAYRPTPSPSFTPINTEANPPARTDLAPAVPLNRSTGVYTPHPFQRPPFVHPIITAIDTLIYQLYPDPNMPRIEGSARSPCSTGKSDP